MISATAARQGAVPAIMETTLEKSNRYRDVEIRAPRGNTLTAKSWLTEAPLRMLMNNLDPDVAENPKELVVYGGIGRAVRDWDCYDKMVAVSYTHLTLPTKRIV